MTDDPLDPTDKDVLDDDLLEDLGAEEASEDDESETESATDSTTDELESTPDETPDEGEAEAAESTEDGRDWGAGAKSVGETVGAGLGQIVLFPPRLLVNGVVGTTVGFTRIIPGAQKIWSKVIKIGYGGYYKTSGADVVGHVMKEGRLKHVPLTWSNENHRFEGPGENNWWLSPGENEHTLLGPGNTPCAWAASKATNLGTQVQAEVAEALDLGYGVQLYTDAEVSIRNVYVDDDRASAGGQGQAVADGGMPPVSQHLTVDDPGVLEDVVVPLSPLYEDSDGNTADARLVSMEKYYETYPEQVDSEEMKKQEDRGRLAAQDPSDYKSLVIKVMLLAALIIAIVELGPMALRMMFGNGGGGGGGGIGLMLHLLSGGA